MFFFFYACCYCMTLTINTNMLHMPINRYIICQCDQSFSYVKKKHAKKTTTRKIK